MQNSRQLLTSILIALIISGCVSNNDDQYSLESSYLERSQQQVMDNQLPAEENNINTEGSSSFNDIPQVSYKIELAAIGQDFAMGFSDDDVLSISSNELPLADFLHYALGDVLNINYLLSDTVKNAEQSITLNIQQKISQRRFFIIVNDLLIDRGFALQTTEDLVYVGELDDIKNKGAIEFGFGQALGSVPNTSSEILQLVPLRYGYKNNLNFVIPQISSVRVTPEPEQNALMLKGKRPEIIKAIEFIQLFDQPAYRERFIGSYKSVYIPITELEKELQALLKKDGFGNGLDTVSVSSNSMLVMFANDQTLLTRAQYWLEKLDVASNDEEKRYFVFQPLYARAADLTESLSPLLGNMTGASSNRSTQPDDQGNGSQKATSASNDKIKIVVDERSNLLLVHSTALDYRSLLPLIKRLDVLPKQVMLEVTIAEVTLTDEFQQGVEFFLEENNFTLGSLGAFGEGAIGGLSYVLTGSNKWNVNASLKQTNKLINIVSRPSLVVRDGVTATMQVGTDIPIINTTVIPDGGTTESVQYRKTGLTLSVTPTVNSRGVVIMEIDQQISNVVVDIESIQAGGAPSIFDRSMKTEVVANSGQTVILGGLISENKNNSTANIPGLSSIPILGHLFSSKSDSKDKTELVIMVTPRIIESAQQWDDIKAAMSQQLKQIVIKD
jgi:general secretion pathway protein D